MEAVERGVVEMEAAAMAGATEGGATAEDWVEEAMAAETEVVGRAEGKVVAAMAEAAMVEAARVVVVMGEAVKVAVVKVAAVKAVVAKAVGMVVVVKGAGVRAAAAKEVVEKVEVVKRTWNIPALRQG